MKVAHDRVCVCVCVCVCARIQCLPHATELISDQFGNYLFQKLVDLCDGTARTAILREVTAAVVEDSARPGSATSRSRLASDAAAAAAAADNHVVRAAESLHGTRSVQKLVEVCRLPDEVAMLVRALSPFVVRLSLDTNGNHVIQVRRAALSAVLPACCGVWRRLLALLVCWVRRGCVCV